MLINSLSLLIICAMSKYPFGEIEKKWQDYWDKAKTFKVTEDPSFPREKRKYILDMFPYPSGAGLHVGHPEGYTATDIYSRYWRMKGYNVLHPMGFDAFGLPAENYAIKTGTHPHVTTTKNIENFTRQLKSLGFSYDWDRMISTCDQSYYKWTQWIFEKLFEKGLAYEASTPINWCPSCKTGLANEEVKEGMCERCGTPVEKKNIRQWILKITAYADRLLEDLDIVDWPESVKTMQRNWIGRSEGAAVFFKIDGMDESLEVYTTRCDTLFGATYMVIAPEHKLVKELTTDEHREEVEKYVEEVKHKSDLERTDLAKTKTGVFTGSYAINPVNGKKIPIWIADYVLISYGTGAIMAVPAHDERDWEFAKKFNLPIIGVLESPHDVNEKVWEEDGKHVNSEWLDGLNKEDAIKKMLTWLEEHKAGHKAVNYKLRDWIFSRQRYWGEPIPLIHCPKCGTVEVPEDDLPLTLPEVRKYEPSGTGESPLVNVPEWVDTKCPKCGGDSKRETNTMPQWAGSCWYYLRFIDPENSKKFVDPEKEKYWMPVDLYVGGTEHAVLHLLYSRFWHKVLYDLGLVSTKEPFQKLVNQGMITSFAYQKKNKVLVPADKVTEKEGKYYDSESGEEVTQVIAKMSKSLKNVINPDDYIKNYGADSVRLYEMFMGPLTESKPWHTAGFMGVYRFLEKVWKIASEKKIVEKEPGKELDRLMNKTIRKVTKDTESLSFNTAISQMMVFANELAKLDEVPKVAMENFALLLSPYAPHISEEMWSMLGHEPSIANVSWPEWDEEKCKDDEIEIAVQVNGKLRGRFKIHPEATKEELLEMAKEDGNVSKWLEGKSLVKEIVVPGKLVNFVVK